MAFKFVALFALIAVANAQQYQQYQQYQQPQYQPQVQQYQPSVVKTIQPALLKTIKHIEHEEDTPAEYSFNYEVHDEQTGDIKRQHEERHGDAVQGEYSLVDADGFHRVVQYHDDGHSGFLATVTRTKLEGHGAPIQKVISSPIHKVIAAPVHYAATPIAKYVVPQQAQYQAPSLQHYATAPAPALQHYANAPVQHASPIHPFRF